MDQDARTAMYEEAMGLVLDLAVEMPIYQRKTLYAYNANHIKGLNDNVNPYSTPLEKLWEVELIQAEAPQEGEEEAPVENNGCAGAWIGLAIAVVALGGGAVALYFIKGKEFYVNLLARCKNLLEKGIAFINSLFKKN